MSSDRLVRMAEKAARGGFFLFVGNTSSTLILAVGVILVARLLGPSGYGLYTLALVVPLLLASLADAGISFALVRLPAKLRSEGDRYRAGWVIKAGFALKLLISAVAFLICYVGAEAIATSLLNRPQAVSLVRLAALLIVFQSAFNAASNSFIGLDLMQYSASFQITQSALKTAFQPVLVLLGFGVAGAISGYTLSLVLAGVSGSAVLFAKHARSAKPPASVRNDQSVGLGVMIGYGLPLYLATIITVFVRQYQNLVLAHFTTNLEIGNFNAAVNFAALLNVLSYPIATAMFPMFSKMKPERDRNEISRAFELSVKYTSLLILPATIAVIALSRDLVYVIYGRGYTLAPLYMSIYVSLFLLSALSYVVLASFLMGIGDTRTYLKVSIVTLVLFLPMAPAFAWVWGTPGVITAFVLSSAASTLYGMHEALARFGVHADLRSSARILLAALLAAIPTLVLSQLGLTGTGFINLIAGGVLYLISYLTLAPILDAVGTPDVDNLTTILSKTPIAATIVRPLLNYERRILSAMSRH